MASRSNSCLVDHIGYDCDYQIRNNGIRISVTYPIYDDETETESGWIDKQTIKDDEDYSHYFNLIWPPTGKTNGNSPDNL